MSGVILRDRVRYPGYSISVDTFHEQTTHYFLTHAHADHLCGLHRDWRRGPIHCDRKTKRLLMLKDKFDSNLSRHDVPNEQCFLVLDEEEEGKPLCLGENLTVTFFYTGHCPGSLMYVFEGISAEGKGWRDCCTGDARFEPEIRNNILSILRDARSLPIDRLYLDTTFACEEWREFQTMARQAQEVADYLTQNRRPNQAVFLDASMIGAEPVLKAIAKKIHPERTPNKHLMKQSCFKP